VQRGELYIYSIRRNGERVATLALGRHEGRAYLEQIRGPCNADPPKPVVATVQRWLRAQKPLPLRQVLPVTERCFACQSLNPALACNACFREHASSECSQAA
jgi:hypothetical protein